MPAIGFEIKRKCKVCGEVFLAKTLDSQYCSPKCSKVAWKRKKDAKEKNEKLDRLAQHISDIREYVSVKEAVAMFGVERTTLYRLIKNGTVPAINVGKRLTQSNAQPWKPCSLPEKKVLQKERNLCPEDTVWNQRTVIPLVRKALSNTKVTVKLRKSVHHDNEWYLFIESYPVYKKGDNKPSRVVESVNRTISTPQWDMSSIARVLPDGSFNYKPKRDVNGIIQCKSRIDQEACIYADNVRKLRQHEYDNAALYSDREEEIIEQKERSAQDFIKYFIDIIDKRHPNSSNAIIVNWNRVGELLKIYSEGKPIPFKSVTVKLLEDIKMFLLRAPLGGNKKGTVSRNTASTYFAIVKAGVKQAFIDEYLTVDVSAKVKGIPSEDKLRASLTLDEVKRLADTPCESDVLRRASFFSILTGLRLIDIKTLLSG